MAPQFFPTYHHWCFIVLIATLLTPACKSSKSSKEPPVHTTVTNWVLKYERTPCFGECPVYVFYLLTDNSGLIDVRYNLLEPGWYAADLDQESVHYLLEDLEPEGWWNEDLSDQPEIADMPGRSIVYKHKEGLRWYALGSRTSAKAEDIFGQLDHLVSEGRWEPSILRPLNPELPEPTDVLVQLKEGVDVNIWMQKYTSFGISLKKRVSPNLNYYVVSKKNDQGAANDFLQYMKHDEDVIDAQWDKELSVRE